MDIEQVALQLGIAGLIILVGYKLVQQFLERWTKVEEGRQKEESRRTDAIAKGFDSIVERVERHATTDLQSHTDLSTRIARFEGKLDEVLNWQERTPVTPVHGYEKPVPSRYAQHKKKDDSK